LGATGRGICEQTGISPVDVDILMGTFTKAFGSVGGYIAADKDLITYLRNENYGLLWASSLSTPACQQVISALSIIMGEDRTTIGATKIRQLAENGNYFRYRAKEMGLHVLGDWGSPICPILVYHPGRVTAFSRLMLERKVAIVVVGYPATHLLMSRSRFCISAAHTRADMDFILDQLREVSLEVGIRFGVDPAHPSAPVPVLDAPDHVRELIARADADASSSKSSSSSRRLSAERKQSVSEGKRA